MTVKLKDSYQTPESLYNELDREFHFDFDPCPFITGDLFNGIPITDGLSIDWGSATFLNPPYSNPLPWVKKAYFESLKGSTVVGLLRADTSTAWFHDWVWHKAEIRFIRNRVYFGGKRTPFANIIVIWRGV